MVADDALVGKVLDGYVLEHRIGAGATGVVYKARRRDATDSNDVLAVKVLNEALGHIKSLRRRFEREARALSKLTHEHIVHIADFGVVDEVVFIAMEYLEGTTLEDHLQDEPVSPTMALQTIRQILEGVAFAHERQIVHRDLKPANVFLVNMPGETHPSVKILDFGLAKFLSIDELSHEGTLTRKGRVVGTPAYMAPAQIAGVSLAARAGVYAAGNRLFELLADRRPFDYDRRSQLLRAHLFEPVPKICDIRPGADIDPALEALVRRALAKDPSERFPDARAMLDELEPFTSKAIESESPARSGERSRAGTSSVVITAEERREISSQSDPAVAPLVAAKHALAETEVESAPLGALPPEPSARPPSRNSDGLMTAAVWVFGLIGLVTLIGLAVYATTLR